ncbi:TIGR02757 family protein [Sediminibacterium soli]|uniref:TIGR02757 family protein n=1 Tax=Sediminibacterium soli TaxID=2698829 RepID=UPI0013798045|nr:TIGR02757 family protein [Sediminibacterium soli]NCI47682.1 TIGR02757 family protein [Sediminibacterium soli]
MYRSSQLRSFLDKKAAQYNRPAFIKDDPVCIPHLFTGKQDIEISGLFAAVFAWGNRTTIINKTRELMKLMDDAPYDFCLHHSADDLKKLLAFRHRTFNATDLLYFIAFLKHHYGAHTSLEPAFLRAPAGDADRFMETSLIHFHEYFFSLEDAPARTKKHISTPYKGSTCKRLNMYLRWMVRRDKQGVDFGIWKKIHPAQLICPIDLHVARVAKHFGLLQRNQLNWQAAVELTACLRTLDAADPVKYDFALFGLGVMEKYR